MSNEAMKADINTLMLRECKALAGESLPFQGGGWGGGGGAMYSSWAAWDRTLDAFSGGVYDEVNYAAKIGDLSRSSLVMAAVRFLSGALPEAPLQVKKKTGDKQKGENEVQPDHALTKLWNRPNDYYSGSTMKKGIAFSWILAGEAYLIKFFNQAGTAPVELWWEPHWTIRPAWPMDGSEFIAHYEVNRNGSWIPIAKEQVFHLRDGLNPMNPRLGLSGNESVMREIWGDMEAAKYYANLMGGSAVPPFFVELDKDTKLNEDQIHAFEARIKQKTTGDRRGEPLVVKGGTPHKLAFNPQEMNLNETRFMPEERFCAVKGIPAVVLELGSGQAHSIYNNVQQAMERAYTSYVKPIWNHIAEELNVGLLEDFEGEGSDFYCEHDLTKVQALQEDEDKKATRLGNLFTKGVLKRSEARTGVGYGSSDPKQEGVDEVFAISRGITLAKPGEDPLAQGSTVPGGIPGQPALPAGPGAPKQLGPAQKPPVVAAQAKPKLVAVKAVGGTEDAAEEVDTASTARWLKRMRFEALAALLSEEDEVPEAKQA